MATAPPVEGPEQAVARVEELQSRLQQTADPATRELADELVSAVLEMYGAGLERIVTGLVEAGEPGEQIALSLAEDPLVAMLLLIHDLHPIPLEQRVQAALDSVRPYMESHGGSVELLGVDRGVARIHLRGSCSDCSASALTLELAIKQALEEAAPDLEGLEVLGVAPQSMDGPGLPMVTGSAPTGIELPVVIAGAPPAPAWHELADVDHLADGELAAATVGGRPLLVANVEGTLLAYRDVCADCGASLHEGRLSAGALACRECGRSFFLPRAGRSLDDENLQLEPVPLLREGAKVRVALAL
jgi:Fe-S cluster biogenesis protein NfuA/nitrite reductase/ring-hydroxylating ferredoxin subunit